MKRRFHNRQNSTHNSALSALRSLLSALCSPLLALSSKFSAHRSKLTAHCPPLCAQRSRLTALCSLLLALCTLLLIVTGCEEKLKPAVTSTAVSRDLPTQESWNTTITLTDSGKLIAILKAGHIASYTDKQYTVFDSNVVVDFYDEFERHTSVLTAKIGRVNDITHDLEAHGNVVVVSDSGTTLKTEDLYWSNRTKKVHTPSFVDIVSPTEHIQGHGFESDRGLRNYTIFKVTGQAKTEE
ncbi:MAG: LPS export ABC transporter periplasmic protein LptC [Bacteroidetes bacterium]|nr:MAG: LPS export ABC transporter periplasmic protein LptC [Bacteroidota bacterium]